MDNHGKRTKKAGSAVKKLPLIQGYDDGSYAADAPDMSFRKMVQLALRTRPFFRPMIWHLLALGALAGSGLLAVFVGAIVGTDLMLNKVAVGEKLQPLQAVVLFLGEEYVATDQARPGPASDADADPASIEPELSPVQRRTVRDRIIVWTILAGIGGRSEHTR